MFEHIFNTHLEMIETFHTDYGQRLFRSILAGLARLRHSQRLTSRHFQPALGFTHSPHPASDAQAAVLLLEELELQMADFFPQSGDDFSMVGYSGFVLL